MIRSGLGGFTRRSPVWLLMLWLPMGFGDGAPDAKAIVLVALASLLQVVVFVALGAAQSFLAALGLAWAYNRAARRWAALRLVVAEVS